MSLYTPVELLLCLSNDGVMRGGSGRRSSLDGGGQSLDGGKAEVMRGGEFSKDRRESYLSSPSSLLPALYGIDGKPHGNLVGDPHHSATCNLGVMSHVVAETAWPAMYVSTQRPTASPITGPTL